MGKKRTKKGRCQKRNIKTKEEEPEELKNAPHSFVFHRGLVGRYVRELVKDFRKMMEPFTASSLQVSKKNTVKDFLSVAGYFHVTHMCIFTHTEISTYMKVARVPRGPTLTFRIENYTLTRDVISSLKKQLVFPRQFENAPLVVLNGFSGEGLHIKLMTSFFQNMFPTINVLKIKLSQIRRCVLFNYDSSNKLIDLRHYAIKVVPTGISRGVKKIIQSKVPNLNRCSDISEFLTNPAQLSESEAEDDPTSHVILPQDLSSRGNNVANKSAIRLVELGPRITFQLIKVEEGLLSGEVLHHELVEKSEEEKLLIKKTHEDKQKLKEKRKRIQEDNKRKKQEKRNTPNGKSVKEAQKVLETDVEMQKAVRESNINIDDDDDTEWYKKEIGENPDEGLFDSSNRGTKRQAPETSFVRKKIKTLATKSAKSSFKKSGTGKRVHFKKNVFNNKKKS